MNPAISPPEVIRLYVLSDDPAVEANVREACQSPNEIFFQSLSDVATRLVEGRSLRDVEAALDLADAALVHWSLLRAPDIGVFSYYFRYDSTPIIAVSEDGSEEHVAALSVGVDHVITLPVQLVLLKALILAHNRAIEFARARPGIASKEGMPTRAGQATALRRGAFVMDGTRYQLRFHGQRIDLTPRQFELLAVLVKHEDRVLSRDELLEQVWGINFETGTNMVDVFIHYLRKRLGAFGLEGTIQTVRRAGYQFSSGVVGSEHGSVLR